MCCTAAKATLATNVTFLVRWRVGAITAQPKARRQTTATTPSGGLKEEIDEEQIWQAIERAYGRPP
jgi:hypothetical protein